MLRRCICLMWAVVVASVMGMEVRAGEQTGSARIVPTWCGQTVEGGIVSLRRVGRKTAEGYELTDGLANWCTKEELQEEEWIPWLISNTRAERILKQAENTGAFFEGLEAGIYLVEQTESPEAFRPFEPFLVSIPEDGWDIVRNPAMIYNGESPKTGDHPAPIIGAMGIGLSVAVLMVLVDERKR